MTGLRGVTELWPRRAPGLPPGQRTLAVFPRFSAVSYGRFGDDERRDVEREYLDSIGEFRDGEGYLVPGEFVIATAVRP